MTIESIEESLGTDYSTVKDFLEQYGGEADGPYLPGDTLSLPGLSDRAGLTFIEAKAEELPPYKERGKEYDDCNTQIKITVHASVDVYSTGKDTLEKVLVDVNEWIVGKRKKYVTVLKREIVRSEQAFHEVNMTILFDNYYVDDFIELKESDFHKTFWNKHMEKIIREGVCYSKGKVTEDLKKKLKANIEELGKKTPIDFHPKSNDIVRDLVHPALYPYIKGVSKLKNSSNIPKDPTNDEPVDFWGRKYEDSKFQWLPTPFEITEDKRVKIKEYINNLDREAFPELYENLENLFEITLPFFEEVWSYSKAVKFFTGDDGEEFDENETLQKEKISFAGRELQVIVKIVDYILQPEQEYEGVWHAEGMSHENIVMTG